MNVEVTACRKCGQIVGLTPRQKYCGNGRDKDNEHEMFKSTMTQAEYDRRLAANETFWDGISKLPSEFYGQITANKNWRQLAEMAVDSLKEKWQIGTASRFCDDPPEWDEAEREALIMAILDAWEKAGL